MGKGYRPRDRWEWGEEGMDKGTDLVIDGSGGRKEWIRVQTS